ncbi:MAG: stage V sporulation protein S [Herpetosiphonaceae bacterium]|nr:MAG: stage V sporulation protein S [Herpetosiphonaceae bacterium]
MEILFSNLYLDNLSPHFASHQEEADHQPENTPVPSFPSNSGFERQPESQQERQGAEVLKVSTKSRPSAVAGAIAGVIRENGQAEVQSIGAGATNQAIKAVAIARSYLQEEGVDIVCIPSFIDVSIDDEERTAIRLLIEKRQTSA